MTYWNRQRNAQHHNSSDSDHDDQELVEEPNIDVHDDSSDSDQNDRVLVEEPNIDHGGNIELPGYLRIAKSSVMCIINNYNNQNLHRIHVAVRRNLLKNNLYIPRGTRICDVHL